MKILVCVKQVPMTTQVEVDPETGVLKRDGTASKLNPYDLFSLEAAFLLRDQIGGTVTTLTMGPNQASQALLETLYMGADNGILLSDRKFAGADVCATSYSLSLAVKKAGPFDLILCGKLTTDGDTAQVGPELAELLGLEHATNVSSLQVEGNAVIVTCSLDQIVQTQRMALPALLCMEKDINTPRLPSFKRRREVREDQITVWSVKDFPEADVSKLGLSGSPTQVERIFPPEKNSEHSVLRGTAAQVSEELYQKLKAEKFI